MNPEGTEAPDPFRWFQVSWLVLVLIVIVASWAGCDAHGEPVDVHWQLPVELESGSPLLDLDHAEVAWAAANVWQMRPTTNGYSYNALGVPSPIIVTNMVAVGPFTSRTIAGRSAPKVGELHGARLDLAPGPWWVSVRAVRVGGIASYWADPELVPVGRSRPGRAVITTIITGGAE
jgi:hypothetical protein